MEEKEGEMKEEERQWYTSLDLVADNSLDSCVGKPFSSALQLIQRDYWLTCPINFQNI